MGDMADYYSDREALYDECGGQFDVTKEYHDEVKDIIDNDKRFYKKMRENKMPKKQKMNKFYMGSQLIASHVARGVNNPWTQATIEEAVEHAKQELENNEDQECAIIVQIVRIIRRKEPVRPKMIVEIVR